MSTRNLGEVVAAVIMEKMNEGVDKRSDAETVAALIQRAELFHRRYEFRPGDIVQFKPGLANGDVTSIFIVMRILPEPIFDAKADSSSADFRAPLDIVLGRLSSAKDYFLEFHYDSRRFEPYVPKAGENETKN